MDVNLNREIYQAAACVMGGIRDCFYSFFVEWNKWISGFLLYYYTLFLFCSNRKELNNFAGVILKKILNSELLLYNKVDLCRLHRPSRT